MSDSLPKVDSISTKDTAPVSINSEASQPVTPKPQKPSDEVKPKTKKSSVGLIISITAVILIVVVALVGFVKIGNQTLLAKGLDGLGQHKTAFGLDYASSQKGLNLMQIQNIDPSKPETCKDLFKSEAYSKLNLDMFSAKATLDLKPVNSSYQDKFNYSSFYDANLNLNKVVFSLDTHQKATTDFDLIQKFTQSTNGPKFGLTTFDALGQGIFSLDDGIFLNVKNIGLKTSSFNASGGLNSWYKQDLALTQVQKEGVKDILSEAKDLLKTSPSSVFSQDSLEALGVTNCSLIESIEFKAPQTVEFGSGDHKVSREVRPLIITEKADINKVYKEKLPALVEKLGKDETFKNFLKGKYDSYLKFVAATDKINGNTEASSNKMSKQDFDKTVDVALKELTKDNTEKYLDSLVQSDEIYTTQIKPLEYYLDMSSLEVYATRQEQVIIPTEKYLNNYFTPAQQGQAGTSQEELRNLLKQGFSIKTEIYDVTMGSNVKNIDVPKDSKTFEDLYKDFSNLDPVKKLDTAAPAEPQSKMPEGTMPTTINGSEGSENMEITPPSNPTSAPEPTSAL